MRHSLFNTAIALLSAAADYSGAGAILHVRVRIDEVGGNL